jgi:hypothetical protein
MDFLGDAMGGLLDTTIGRIPVVGESFAGLGKGAFGMVTAPQRIMQNMLSKFGLGGNGNNNNGANGAPSSSTDDITTIALIGGGGLVAILLVKKFLF